jgi:hypothetical protein
VARFAQAAGFDQARALELGLLFNSFAVYGPKYLPMPIDMPKANQGVAVDEHHFYAVDNTVITKHDTPQSIADVSIRGQGIAWDRSRDVYLYGIIRATSAERKAGIIHKVTVSMLQY